MNNWFEILGATEFPALWEKILERRVLIYRLLPEFDRCELRSYIRWFIGSKQFEGCDGLVITDEIRVTVAAQACLLLLHRQTPCYERLRLIRVYPRNCFAQSSAETASGESWQHGVVLLAWDSVRGGAANPYDGDNVVLHEFAHQLDQEEGDCDGTPRLGRGMTSVDAAGVYTSWARMLSREYEEFRFAVEQGGKRVMDSYGASNPTESFAVATECFFEKPKQLCKRHPELYAALKQFYKQDPAAWATDTARGANEALEPRVAAAGSQDNSDVGAEAAVAQRDARMAMSPIVFRCTPLTFGLLAVGALVPCGLMPLAWSQAWPLSLKFGIPAVQFGLLVYAVLLLRTKLMISDEGIRQELPFRECRVRWEDIIEWRHCDGGEEYEKPEMRKATLGKCHEIEFWIRDKTGRKHRLKKWLVFGSRSRQLANLMRAKGIKGG